MVTGSIDLARWRESAVNIEEKEAFDGPACEGRHSGHTVVQL